MSNRPDVRRLLRNALIDVRFGPPLGGVFLRNRAQSNSDYRELEAVFVGRLDRADVLVDVGCGAGRVINQWLRTDAGSHIYGLEMDERLAAKTRRRLRRHSNVTIIDGDAVSNLPLDGTVFFLFNPFDAPTTRRFAQSILELARTAVRPVTVIYLNCKHLTAFEDDSRFVIEYIAPDSDLAALVQPLAIITVNPRV